MKDWTPEERELFEQSRKLKEKARGLVAKRTAAAREAAALTAWRQARIAREREEAAKRTTEAERLAQKGLRDDRIRSALLKMAEAAEAHQIAFLTAPEGMVQYAFSIVDKGPADIWRNSVIKINITPTGFQWD